MANGLKSRPQQLELLETNSIPNQTRNQTMSNINPGASSSLEIFLSTIIDLAGEDQAINQEFLFNLLRDCSYLSTLPNAVKDKRLHDPKIFYGLAGYTLDDGNMLSAIASRAEEFIDNPPTSIESLYKALGGSAMLGIGFYHKIRDNLQLLQKKLQISAVRKETKTIRGQEVKYLDYNDQFFLLNEDIQLLKTQVPKIVEFFFQTTIKYIGFEQLENEELVPLITGRIAKALAHTDYAWISHESYQWINLEDGSFSGHMAEKAEPDKINLVLCEWNEVDQDYSNLLWVEAHHPDFSRFPWKTC